MNLERQFFWNKNFRWNLLRKKWFGLRRVYLFNEVFHLSKHIRERWFWQGYPNTPMLTCSTKEALEDGYEKSVK
ncbi:MAG: hypothetical protein GY861_03325 [bacterium]|nr:hypothetical protein [bacterium]